MPVSEVGGVALEETGPEIGGVSEAPPSGDVASVVLVEQGEDLAAVCGRIDAAPTWAVVIHAPGGNRQLSSALGMRRLIHHSGESGKVIAIATRSSALASRARELGVPVARKPQHVRWDAGGRHVVRMGRFSLSAPSFGRYVQVGVIVSVAVVGMFLLFAMAPSASLTAYPPTETVSEVVTVSALEGRTDIDLTNRLLPATRVTGEQKYTLAVKATGVAQVGVLPAKARVTISNASAAAVLVAGGTIVLASPDFFPFALDEAVTVPAGGSIEAAVTAQKAGANGNVAAGAIVGWQAERFRFLKVANAAAAAGGTSEPRQAVDPGDVLSLQSLAKALETSDAVRKGLIDVRPHDAIFLGTAEGKAEFSDARPAVGTPADIVLLDVTVKVSALAVVEATLQQLATAVLGPLAGNGEFIPGSVKAIETGARQIDTESGEIRTELRIEGELARGVTAAELREAIKGKTKDDARSTLSKRYGIQDADVRLSGWAPRIPRFGFRIDVALAAREPATNPGSASQNASTAITTTAATASPGAGSR
ncbi:MAG: baseplate J/gp47 family protein [bacterium]